MEIVEVQTLGTHEDRKITFVDNVIYMKVYCQVILFSSPSTSNLVLSGIYTWHPAFLLFP